MPRKPKHPCGYPGCPNLVESGERYCEECLKRGVYTKMKQIHHIKPLAEGRTHARENLMSLCSSCHSRIHAERGDRWHSK